jgi:hypothetical protein
VRAEHGSACGRRLARQVEAAEGSKYDAAEAIHSHCGVSLLRAHRIAHGLTLAEAVEQIKHTLRQRGTPSEGLAHQRLSRWEKGLDVPTPHYLDALCFLYRTRPDRLGYGTDYTPQDSRPDNDTPYRQWKVEDDVKRRTFLRSSAVSVLAASSGLPIPGAGSASDDHGHPELEPNLAALGALEERTELSGYQLYTTDPADYIPFRTVDIAAVQRLLLTTRSPDAQKRLHRLIAKNAGFIAIRMIDVAPIEDTFNWFRIARRAARQAEDRSVEAWVAGHWADSYVCYEQVTSQALAAAKSAQAMCGSGPTSMAVYGALIEAGVQARLGRRHETLEAVRRADRMFSALPPEAIAEDGLRVPEYFLRWHQSNALAAIGEERLADPLRTRTRELPFAEKDVVGRALLDLDQAALLLRAGEIDRGCGLITSSWQELPAEFRTGLTLRRTRQILETVDARGAGTKEVRSLREYFREA